MRSRRPAGPAPTEAQLHEAALAHLARFSATEAGLLRVLERRIARWARAALQEENDAERIDAASRSAQAAARAVAARLVAAGAVNDAAFAAARARRLARSGRSRRAIAAHLAQKGVDADTAQAVLPEDELTAALAFVRRRRLGPFRAADASADPDQYRRELAALARAGFAHDVAVRALSMARPEAEDRLFTARST